MKRGWWKVRFDVTLDGIGIDFDELSAQSKRNIQAMLAQGCVAGEIEETEGEESDDRRMGDQPERCRYRECCAL